MKEEEPLANNADYGKDENANEALLKKCNAFETDISVHGNRCTS